MSTPLDKIVRRSYGRIAQLKLGVGNNDFTRVSDVNPIIDYLNNRSSLNVVTGVSAGTTTASTVTIDAVAGAFTTVAMTAATTVGITVTVTDSFITTGSIILAQITGFSGTWGTNGAPMIASIIPSAGSFVINITNGSTNTMTTQTMDIKFIVL